MHKLVSRSRSLMEGKGGRRHAGTKAPVTYAPNEPLHGGPESVSDTTLHVPPYNYYATPVESLNELNQYARRPLPATPPSIAKMADRPSTSGGPASRKSGKNDLKFDKRVSRDDFYLGSRTYGGSRAGPVPRPWDELLTPDPSPKTKSIQKFASATSGRNLTINASVEVLDGGIGMALGSPSHTRNFSDPWNTPNTARSRQDLYPIATPPESRSSSVDTFDMPVLRKSSSKWKLFSIFSRKPPDEPVPAISISDPNGLYGTNRPEEKAMATRQAPLPEQKNPTRSNTATSRKVFKHKPILIRSQTLPSNAQVDIYDQRLKAGEKQSRGPSPAPLPLLNVEIPDVRLERYSVMFDGVLKSNPSLLSRRQATVPKLKSIKDAVEREEEVKPYGMARRATSPQPTTKPSGFVLFPTKRENQGYMPQKLSPRLRSNTSPALLPSPSKATFDHKAPNYRRPSVEHQTSLKPPPQTFHYEIERPDMAVTTDTEITEQGITPLSPPRFSNDQSNLILDSPSEINSDDNEETVASEAWKPASYHPPPEPKWQMMVPSQKTPSTASSNNSSYRKRSPSLASSSYTHITRVSEDSDDASSAFFNNSTNNIAITAKMTPVEISIARQITVSRQQRKLLQPLRTVIPPAPAQPSSSSSGRRPSHPSPARTSPMTGLPRGEQGRIAETKTSTPTLVSPDSLDPDQYAARAQLRRSERIVLEDA